MTSTLVLKREENKNYFYFLLHLDGLCYVVFEIMVKLLILRRNCRKRFVEICLMIVSRS